MYSGPQESGGPLEWRRARRSIACVTGVTRAALDAGAAACMLYTDVTNPTSNALYQRLG